jgi:fused signal recognition particle receptor
VFKRLREGLFGRQEEERSEEQRDELESDEASTPPDEVESPEDVADAIEVEDASPIESVASSQAFGNAAEEPEEPEEFAAAISPDPAPRRGFGFNPFKLSLGRTRQLFGRVNDSLAHDPITDDLWDELEETLISSDVGVETTERLMTALRERVEAERLTSGSELRGALKEELELLLGDPEPLVFSETSPITVLLFVGVNGVGKTTSIAKVGALLKKQKHHVMLAAGDTFRAAAVEQLKTWGERIGVPVIAQHQGADAAAVVYDAMQAAQSRGADVLLVDTAGRLHTKTNLMEELKKIVRVLQRYDPEAPHEVLLTLDAVTGQNGLAQAKQFVKDAGVSGVVLTKLDGTARGGIVFAIASELGLPIKFIGTGERVGDLEPFDADEFIDALFASE